jgi:hypothetical protein
MCGVVPSWQLRADDLLLRRQQRVAGDVGQVDLERVERGAPVQARGFRGVVQDVDAEFARDVQEEVVLGLVEVLRVQQAVDLLRRDAGRPLPCLENPGEQVLERLRLRRSG